MQPAITNLRLRDALLFIKEWVSVGSSSPLQRVFLRCAARSTLHRTTPLVEYLLISYVTHTRSSGPWRTAVPSFCRWRRARPSQPLMVVLEPQRYTPPRKNSASVSHKEHWKDRRSAAPNTTADFDSPCVFLNELIGPTRSCYGIYKSSDSPSNIPQVPQLNLTLRAHSSSHTPSPSHHHAHCFIAYCICIPRCCCRRCCPRNRWSQRRKSRRQRWQQHFHERRPLLYALLCVSHRYHEWHSFCLVLAAATFGLPQWDLIPSHLAC